MRTSSIACLATLGALTASACSAATSGTPTSGSNGGGSPLSSSGGVASGAGGAATGYGGTSGPVGNGGSPVGGIPGGGGLPPLPMQAGGLPGGGSPGVGGFVGVGGVIGGGGTVVGMAGAPAGGAMGIPGPAVPGCPGETMPAVTDYSANGPLQTMVVNSTGSDGMYTVYRPATLGQNGMKNPIATWGNGITTTPSYYPGLLGAIASHGFVVIASNSSNVTAQLMTAGLDWMIQQNDASGPYQGKLNTTCLVTIGYSLGGGASVGAGSYKNVVATASMHGVTGPSNTLHAPLLLLTAETDTFVVPATFVTPTFTASAVQTFYGTLSSAADPGNSGHLIPVDLLPSMANTLERAAMIAWLRLWVYGDQGAKKYFYGDDCVLCKDPWTMPQRKNWQ